MSQIRTPQERKRPRWALFAGVILLAIFAALAIFTVEWMKERKESLIIRGGPFDTYFSKGLYPDHKQEIEAWIESALPVGTTKADANRILAPSFSSEITGGNEVTIDSTSNSAGSQHTKVTLTFDSKDGFKDVKVDQHWAYL